MQLKICRRAEQITSSWSGGATTQLCIYPENSTLQARDFLFRISTATVESESSTFTVLPGVERQLMVLDRLLVITHENNQPYVLNPFESARFKGDWLTTSQGKATDFNVMTGEPVEAALSHVHIGSGGSCSESAGNVLFVAFYLYEGNATMWAGNQKYELDALDLVLIGEPEGNISFTAGDSAELIITRIFNRRSS